MFRKILCLAFVLLLALCGLGCSEEEEAAGQDEGEAAQLSSLASRTQLQVGEAVLPMPAPKGFRALKQEDPQFHSSTDLEPGEVLLRVYGKSPSKNPGPERKDLIWVTTLDKWLEAQVDELGFIAQKQQLQKESAPGGPEVLRNFRVAAIGWLAAEPSYAYSLGMLDNSSHQISFGRVLKESVEGKALYSCRLDALLYRNGKLLGLHFLHHMGEGYEDLPMAIADFLSYLYALQALDGNLPDREVMDQSLGRYLPAGK
ncbi:hypothetical protein LJC36_03510 [Desulfovibrio sp. OttesenSCG-928-C14]|nr:hypothetical protein [Desulfovibrio sp. OttesenSCG-928-C14]